MTTTTERPAPLTVGDLLTRPPLMPVWPDFGRDVCQLSRAEVYRLAAADLLPVPVVWIGSSPTRKRGKRFVRTADVLAWLNIPGNSEAAAAATATTSDERIALKDGARS
jgi:hypothetical protein